MTETIRLQSSIYRNIWRLISRANCAEKWWCDVTCSRNLFRGVLWRFSEVKPPRTGALCKSFFWLACLSSYIYICIGHKLLKKIASLNLFKLRYMAAAIEPGPAVVSKATEGICKICAAYPASCRLKNHEILPSQKIHQYQLKRNHFERYIPLRTSIFSGDVRRRLPGDLWLGVCQLGNSWTDVVGW